MNYLHVGFELLSIDNDCAIVRFFRDDNGVRTILCEPLVRRGDMAMFALEKCIDTDTSEQIVNRD